MDTSPALAFENEVANVVADRMTDLGLQQLPVVDSNGKLIGMLHYHTLLATLRKQPEGTALVAKDVMTTKVLRITPKDKVGTAAELFADARFKVLPVVNLRNELKGVVTAFNLIKLAFNREYRNPILYKDAFVA